MIINYFLKLLKNKKNINQNEKLRNDFILMSVIQIYIQINMYIF